MLTLPALINMLQPSCKSSYEIFWCRILLFLPFGDPTLIITAYGPMNMKSEFEI